jgi:hypothetical protein
MNARVISGLAAATGLLAWAAAAAGQGVWVSNDGKSHVIGAGTHSIMIDDEGGERFNLADLRDGETRVFGRGDKQLTATRDGDEVELTRPARGKESALRVTCQLSSDQCSVVTFGDEPDKVMVLVQKERVCVDGEGDCDVDIDIVRGIGGHESGARVIVTDLDCADADCEELAGPEGPMKIIRVHASHESSHVSLRCPKGDTTMRVDTDDADKTYLCPKHSLRLEKR